MIVKTLDRGRIRAGALSILLLVLLAAPAASAAPEASGRADGSQLHGVVNVNTATAEELEQLPGVGEARARAIVDLRKEKGGFQTVEQLMQIKGIGSATLDRLRPHLAVKGRTTLRRE